MVFNDKSCLSHGIQSLFLGNHIGDPVASLNAQANGLVVFVALLELVRHDPFVNTEDTTRLQDTENLRVDTLEGWCVHSRFNCVSGIEAVFREVDLLDDATMLVSKSALDVQLSGHIRGPRHVATQHSP